MTSRGNEEPTIKLSAYNTNKSKTLKNLERSPTGKKTTQKPTSSKIFKDEKSNTKYNGKEQNFLLINIRFTIII